MTNQVFNGIRFIKLDNGYFRAEHDFTLYMHRYVWEYYNGKIPRGCEIHHIDFDKSNNDISNLQLLTAEEHQKLHAQLLTDEQREWKRNNIKEKAQPEAVKWHKSEIGREWHRKLIKQQRDSGVFDCELICKNCGKSYIGKRNGNNNFCSGVCKSAYRRKSGKNNIIRICVICGNEFITDKYKHATTCSRSCANKLRYSRRGN